MVSLWHIMSTEKIVYLMIIFCRVTIEFQATTKQFALEETSCLSILDSLWLALPASISPVTNVGWSVAISMSQESNKHMPTNLVDESAS
jgi:hypothetical protein